MVFINDTLTYGLNFKRKIATGLNKSGRVAYFGQLLVYDIMKLHASSTSVQPGNPNSIYYIMTDAPITGTSAVPAHGFSGIVRDATGKQDGEEVQVQIYGFCDAYMRGDSGSGTLVYGARLSVPQFTGQVQRVLDNISQSTAKVVAQLRENYTAATSAAGAGGLAEAGTFPTVATDSVVLTNYSIQLVDVLFNGIEGIGR